MSQGAIVDLYPCSPMQQGMLFHALYSPGSAMYFEQMSARLQGRLDSDAFRRAWQHIADRHPVLRSAFVWEDLDQPHQVVLDHVEIPLHIEDWRGAPAPEQERRLDAFMAAERMRGFDPATPPLMRIALFRTGDDSHRLVWSCHHLLLDGWSTPLLFRDVFAAYSAFQAGGEPDLPPARPYRDYIAWLLRQDMAAAEAFWRRQLDGLDEPARLPLKTARDVSSNVPAAPGRQQIAMEAGVTARLQSLARDRRVTLNTVVQAAWALVLSRYSRSNDVVFGVTVSGRPPDLPGVESIVGMFINTLPMRARLDNGTAFGDLCRQLHERQQETTGFQYSPLFEVQRWSGLPHDQKLFDSIFVFENYPMESAAGGTAGLHIDDIRSFEQTNYPLNLIAVQGERLTLRLLHDRARTDDDSAQRMLGHLAHVLEGVAENPDGALETFCLLTPDEWQRVVVEWNGTATDYPRDATLAQLFEGQVAKTPDAIAVEYDAEALTYAELNARANQLSYYLREKRVGPGTFVALYLERSVDLIVATLGIIKAGGAYVPLDPDYPDERLAFMLEDTGASVLLTQSSLAMAPFADAADTFCMDADWDGIGHYPEENPPHRGQAGDIAYVIYTSGSTGVPKGVCVPQRAITRLVRNTDYIQIATDDRIAQASNASFDAATFEIWGALLNGARLVGVSKYVALSPADFSDALQRQGITMMFLTTALFNQVARSLPYAFRSLRSLLVGGEAVDPGAMRAVLEAAPPQRLLNAYGPTENTTFSTWHHVTAVDEGAATVPIGRPIANSHAYVLDQAMQPAPVGVPGELYCGGDGLALGYLKREELTAERFVPNPFGGDPASRLYRTGDLVVLRENGAIDFIARLDDQVKLRGFRVELGEIEAVIGRFRGIRQCAVLARQDRPGDKRLVAYVVPADGAEVDDAALRAHLREHLPEYMVPAACVILDALPVTRNGKLDRRALPPPEDTGGEASSVQRTAPRTPREEKIAAVWREILGREDIGVHDHFLDVGGHSLLALQMVTKLNESLGASLPLRTLFEHPTIAGLASLLGDAPAERQAVSEAPQMETTEAAPRDIVLPDYVIAVQPSGEKAPFFCMAPAGGVVFPYYAMAHYFDKARPFYALQDPSLEGGIAPYETVEELAAHYIAGVRAVQPEGPYHLGGWSFGGVVAAEMARQLTSAGATVGVVAVFDAALSITAEHRKRPLRERWADWWREILFTTRLIGSTVQNIRDCVYLAFARSRSGSGSAVAELRSRWQRMLWNRVLLRAQMADVIPRDENLQALHQPVTRRFPKIVKANMRSVHAYHPRPYDGRVTVFRASVQPRTSAAADLALGWGKVARHVDVQTVPGDHVTILRRPNVETFAALLSGRLDACDTGER